MKNLNIEVCVCTQCVMDGAMDIIEAIDELKGTYNDLLEKYNTDVEINVTPVKCLGESKHSAHSPKVSINGHIYENASSETVMAEIINIIKKDVL